MKDRFLNHKSSLALLNIFHWCFLFALTILPTSITKKSNNSGFHSTETKKSLLSPSFLKRTETGKMASPFSSSPHISPQYPFLPRFVISWLTPRIQVYLAEYYRTWAPLSIFCARADKLSGQKLRNVSTDVSPDRNRVGFMV